MERTARSGSEPAGRTGGPVRTCVGCRSRDEQTALLRVVAERDGAATWRLVPDGRRRGQGRGAYVHPEPSCLELAIARRAFGRALRLPAGSTADTTEVERRLAGRQT